MSYFDASTLLVLLQSEPAVDVVERELPSGTVSAVNWSEAAQTVRTAGGGRSRGVC